MTNKKRITSFLLAFVMMFTVLAGTISSATEPETTPTETKVDVTIDELKVDGTPVPLTDTTNLTEYGIKFVNGNIKIDVEKNVTEVNGGDPAVVYTVVSDKEYTVTGLTVGNTASTDKKFSVANEDVTLKLELKTKKYTFKANLEFANELNLSVKTEILNNLTFNKSDATTTTAYTDGKESVNLVAGKYKFGAKLPEGYALFIKEGTNYKQVSNPYEIDLKDNTELTFKVDKNVDYTKRLHGKDRFKTAVEVAKESYGTEATAVVIANGNVSADALSVGPLANELNAPIILVEKDGISEVALEYITDSKATKLYIAGGTGSVSDKVVKEIQTAKEITVENTKRVAGSDRYETSLEIARVLLANHGYNKSVILAHGTIDADALAASTYATEMKMPIILSATNGLTELVKNGLKSAQITTAEIIGGANTLPESVRTDANLAIAHSGRIAGATRYETSVEVAKKLIAAEKLKTVIIANGGKGSVDALASAPLAKVKKAAILLTPGETLIKTQEDIIEKLKGTGKLVYITGGENSVKEAVVTSINNILNK